MTYSRPLVIENEDFAEVISAGSGSSSGSASDNGADVSITATPGAVNDWGYGNCQNNFTLKVTGDYSGKTPFVFTVSTSQKIKSAWGGGGSASVNGNSVEFTIWNLSNDEFDITLCSDQPGLLINGITVQ